MTAATDHCAGPDWTAGHSLLTRMARTGRVFASNDCRDELRALGFSRFTSGRAFQIAEAAGVIRQCGVRKSTDGPSRGAFVREWVGCQVGGLGVLIPSSRAEVVVPVQRDRGGRFTAAPAFKDVPLPLEMQP